MADQKAGGEDKQARSNRLSPEGPKKERISRVLGDELRPGDLLGESKLAKPDGRTFHLTLTLVRIEPTPFSKSLIYHYRLEAHTDVPDTYLSFLGFDGKRLKALDLAPQAILLAHSESKKEMESGDVARYHKALISGFEKWIASKDFNQKMKEEIVRHMRTGPLSGFRDSQ